MNPSNDPWRSIRAALWALTGAVVIIFVFFAAMGGIDPGEAKVACIVVAVLAVLWLAHSWRRFTTSDEVHINPADRERRGF